MQCQARVSPSQRHQDRCCLVGGAPDADDQADNGIQPGDPGALAKLTTRRRKRSVCRVDELSRRRQHMRDAAATAGLKAWGAWLTSLMLTLLLASGVDAETLTGRVVYVVDGDTVTVQDAAYVSHRIRLSGIDAPELKQRFGGRAKQHLFRLVFDKTVSVEYEKRDDHGRIVGKIMVASPDACPDASNTCPKTLDAGLAQLTVGLAWWYRYYAAEQSEEDQRRYEFAEYEARARKAGLWVDDEPAQPREWRRRNRR